MFFIAIGSGAIVAYLLRKYHKITCFLVAGYAGYTFGVALANGFYFIW